MPIFNDSIMRIGSRSMGIALMGKIITTVTPQQMSAIALAAGGLLYDPSDLTSIYQSRTGGSTGATGQPVGIMLDKSNMGGTAAAAFIAAQPELVVNGSFGADATWTKGAGWTIAGGVGVGTATSGDLSQAILTVGNWYRITFDATVNAGTITPKAGSGASGTAVSATASGITVVLRAATTTSLIFTGAAFTGTIDNVSVKVIPGFHAKAPSDSARPTLTVSGGLTYLTADGVDDWFQVFPTLNLGNTWTHVGGWLAAVGATTAFATTNQTTGRLRGYAIGPPVVPIWRLRNTADTTEDFIASGGDATLAHVVSVEKTSATSATGRMNGQFSLTIGVKDITADTQGLALFSSQNTAWSAGLNGRFYGGAWLPANVTAADRQTLEIGMSSLCGVTL